MAEQVHSKLGINQARLKLSDEAHHPSSISDESMSIWQFGFVAIMPEHVWPLSAIQGSVTRSIPGFLTAGHISPAGHVTWWGQPHLLFPVWRCCTGCPRDVFLPTEEEFQGGMAAVLGWATWLLKHQRSRYGWAWSLARNRALLQHISLCHADAGPHLHCSLPDAWCCRGLRTLLYGLSLQQIIAICKARVKLEPLEVLAEEGKGVGPALRQLHRIQVGPWWLPDGVLLAVELVLLAVRAVVLW